jgi:CheY-like chemotaxis protein
MPAGGTLVIAAENIEADAESLRRQPDVRPGPHVLLRVSDTGTGIPPEIADRIFDPFFTTKEEGKGTGLGLSTVHGIVKSHGGFVRLKSELGRGTSFEIYLPAMHEAEPAAPAAASRVAVPRGQQELILVVDDEESIRRVLRQTLERHGYRVVTANDGAEGSVAFAQHRDEIKLVITDVDMPFMSGPNLIRAVRQMNPQVKFILSSGLSSGTLLHEELAELEPFEVRTLLRKPYTAEKILSAVERELKGEAAGPENA